jgi:DNA repair protein RecO (recombination protein O)
VPQYQGSALILRRWDLGESDLLVSFLDEVRGKRRGVAKGAKRSKKRFGGLLSPFVLVRMEYFERPGSPLVRIEGCSLVRYYGSLYRDLGKLLVGCTFLELLERVLPESEDSRAFFPLLAEAFDVLDRGDRAGAALWVFLVKCLSLLGMEPQFQACVHCRRRLGSRGVFGFSVPQGGAVCGDCSRKVPVSHRVDASTLSLLDQWSRGSLEEAQAASGPSPYLREAQVLLEAFVSYHVVRELRSLLVLKKVERGEKQKGDCRDRPGTGFCP